jgi:hypothetical protein
MIATPASLRSDFIHIVGMAIYIAPESTNHITGIGTHFPTILPEPTGTLSRAAPFYLNTRGLIPPKLGMSSLGFAPMSLA